MFELKVGLTTAAAAIRKLRRRPRKQSSDGRGQRSPYVMCAWNSTAVAIWLLYLRYPGRVRYCRDNNHAVTCIVVCRVCNCRCGPPLRATDDYYFQPKYILYVYVRMNALHIMRNTRDAVTALYVRNDGGNAHDIFSSSVTRAPRAEHNPFTARRTTAEATALRRRSGRSSRSGCFDFARALEPPPVAAASPRRRASHPSRPSPAPRAQTARRFSSRRRRRSRTYRKSAARIQP